MSHYIVLVVGDNPEDQLSPYDEAIEVAPYMRDCYCIGRKAEHDARDFTDKTYKTIDQLRIEYNVLPKDNRPDWNEWIKEYTRIEDEHAKEHPLYNKPDPKCPECEGTGKMTSTYNQKSKWDWYVLGGRWLGYFKLKKGCKGKLGRAGVGDNAPEHDADQAKKGDINFTKTQIPLAVVKDGKWYENGKMGWWGMITDEKPEDEWTREYYELLEDVPDDTILSAYDCHI